MLARSYFISVGMTLTSRSTPWVVLKMVPATTNASVQSLVLNSYIRSASNRVLCCSFFSLILSRYYVSVVSDVYPPSKMPHLAFSDGCPGEWTLSVVSLGGSYSLITDTGAKQLMIHWRSVCKLLLVGHCYDQNVWASDASLACWQASGLEGAICLPW